VDADWANDLADRKSVSGFGFRVGRATISWASHKQACVTASSTEAEFVAASEAAKEAIWLRTLLENLGYKQQGPTAIDEDNHGAIKLSKNDSAHHRTKHIAVRFCFIREKTQAGEVILRPVPTERQLADMFTKAITRVKLNNFVPLLGLLP
jgi:hypothetical protein